MRRLNRAKLVAIIGSSGYIEVAVNQGRLPARWVAV